VKLAGGCFKVVSDSRSGCEDNEAVRSGVAVLTEWPAGDVLKVKALVYAKLEV